MAAEEEVQLRISWDPDYVEPAAPIYSNFVGGSLTPEDISLVFGWYFVGPTSAPVNGVVEATAKPVARVVLPLNLVRNLIGLLERQVEAYERNFGPIPPHPNPPAWMTVEAAEEGVETP
jgi:hypothetical protein